MEKVVLSLFDGMSCCQLALNRAGISYDKYYASEIDKHAIKVTQHNFPNTIQLGSVVDVNIKTICLSEVYSYFCHKYFNNDLQSLQNIISEQEMLHRINEEQTFAAYFGTQEQVEISEAQQNTAISVNDRIWFWRNRVGGIKDLYDIIRGGNRGAIANKTPIGELCKHSFWWNGDRQQESGTKEEGVGGNDGDKKVIRNKAKNTPKSDTTVFDTRSEGPSEKESSRTIFRPTEKTELSGCYEQERSGGDRVKEKRDPREIEADQIYENERGLSTKNEPNGTVQDNRVFLPFYNKIQVTIIQCEWGVIIDKYCPELTVGGSPCQSFSFAGKRKGMSTKCETEILTLEQYLQLKSEGFEFEGQSYLFWEYMRILKEVKPKYFLLENVMMGEKWEKILSKAIGVNPIEINSALVSAQNRRRNFWTNIGMIPGGLFGDPVSIIQQPKDKGILLKDILESEVDSKYFLSDSAIKGIIKHKAEQKEKGFGFGAVIKNGHEKMNALKIGGSGVDDLIVHNTMPRSSKTGKEGTGPLSRNDGKTYCLDTGQTNAVEIVACDIRTDEGLRVNKNNKSFALRSEAGGVLKGIGLMEIREVKQINPSEESGGKQPYQQNRVYDENGISPCLDLDSSRKSVYTNSSIRRLTPTECERLQTVPDGYTAHVSCSQRYKMLGNGWTISVISHIFSYIK